MLIGRVGGDKQAVANRIGVSVVSIDKYLRGAVGPSRGTIGRTAASVWPDEYDWKSPPDCDAARERLLKMRVDEISALPRRSWT